MTLTMCAYICSFHQGFVQDHLGPNPEKCQVSSNKKLKLRRIKVTELQTRSGLLYAVAVLSISEEVKTRKRKALMKKELASQANHTF